MYETPNQRSMANQANETMDKVADKAQNVVDYVKQNDTDTIVSDAKAKATEWVETAKDSTSDMQMQAGDKANEALNATGQQMTNLAQTVLDKAPPQLSDAAVTAADALERGGNYLQEADVESIRADLEGMVRRYPMQSLLLALGVGYLFARSMRR